jgi:hypothetical protein
MSTIADRLRGSPVLSQQAELPSHSALWGSAAPDSPDLFPSGPITDLALVSNALPREDGSYGPANSPTAISNALNAVVKGSIALTDSNSAAWNFAGDGTTPSGGDLYESNDYVFNNVSKAGGYTILNEEFWSMTEFDTQVIATNISDPVQAKVKGALGDFADLITSTAKPQARYAATVGNFLVLGNIFETSDGNVPNRVWWSGFRDTSTFDPSTTTQSDFEDLPFGGEVQGLVGGQEYGVIFQTNHIRRMTYRGDAAIWDFDPVDRTRGTNIPRSITGRGRLLGYIAEEGFMMFDGLTSTEIGDGQVDRSFWSEFDPNQRNAVSAAIDPVNKLLIWAYPANGGIGGLPNKLAIFNYKARRWATVDIECDMVFTTKYLGVDVDSPDPRLADIDNSVWSDTSLDSIIFKGGFQSISIYNQQHELSAFDGPALAMRMESKDLSLFAGQSAQVNRVRSLIEGDVRVFIGARNVQGDPITYLPAVEKGANGLSNFRTQANKARYHRICLETDPGATWDKASGYQAYAQPRGIYVGD